MTPSPYLDRLLTVRQLAARLGVSESAVRKRIQKHQIPTRRFGWALAIDPSDLVGSKHEAAVAAEMQAAARRA